jgi:signal transduction histidine kinase
MINKDFFSLKLLIILLSFLNSFSAFSQKNKSFWIKIKTEETSEKILKKIENYRKKAKTWDEKDQLKYHQFLAEINYELSRFESSRIQSDYGLTLAEKLKNDSLRATFLRYKGRNFYFLQNKENAIFCFKEGLKIVEKTNFYKLKADLLTNLAIVRIDEVKISDAEKLLEQAIEVFNLHSDSLYPGFLQARYLLIACYRYTKKVKNVIPLCDELLIDLRKTKETKLLAGHLFFYSFCLAEDGEDHKAIELLDEAIKLTENSDNIDLRRQALNEKATILSKIGQFKRAYYASNESLKLYSKMLKRDVARAASEADVKYQTKQKEEKIKAQKLELKKEQNEKIFLLILILFSVFIFVIIYLFLRKNHHLKTSLLIRKQKEESLQKIIEGQENERTRIAKELHDGIVQDLTVLKINLSEINEKSELESKLTKITKELRELSYQMMPISLKELGLIPALEDLFERSFTKNGISFDFEAFLMEERLDEKIEVNIYRICQELINNTLKHAKATEVNVVLRKMDNILTLIFEDNGQGFDISSSKSGIGLTSLKSRLASIQGEIEYDSELNKGTTAFIKVVIE